MKAYIACWFCWLVLWITSSEISPQSYSNYHINPGGNTMMWVASASLLSKKPSKLTVRREAATQFFKDDFYYRHAPYVHHKYVAIGEDDLHYLRNVDQRDWQVFTSQYKTRWTAMILLMRHPASHLNTYPGNTRYIRAHKQVEPICVSLGERGHYFIPVERVRYGLPRTALNNMSTSTATAFLSTDPFLLRMTPTWRKPRAEWSIGVSEATRETWTSRPSTRGQTFVVWVWIYSTIYITFSAFQGPSCGVYSGKSSAQRGRAHQIAIWHLESETPPIIKILMLPTQRP